MNENVEDFEEKYEMSNGLIDMKRDIFMKLFKIINNTRKIRMIVGVSHDFYEWSKHHMFFLLRREATLSAVFFNKEHSWTGGNEILENKIRFVGEFCFFVDVKMELGKYKIVFSVRKENYSYRQYCGLVNLKALEKTSIFSPFYHQKGSCAIHDTSLLCGGTKCFSNKNERFLSGPELKSGGHTIGLELHTSRVIQKRGAVRSESSPDAIAKGNTAGKLTSKTNVTAKADGKLKGGTLYLYVDDKQIPHSFTDIKEPVQFAFSMVTQNGLRVLSFQRVSEADVIPVIPCAEYVFLNE